MIVCASLALVIRGYESTMDLMKPLLISLQVLGVMSYGVNVSGVRLTQWRDGSAS